MDLVGLDTPGALGFETVRGWANPQQMYDIRHGCGTMATSCSRCYSYTSNPTVSFWVKNGHRNYIPNYLDFSIPRYFNISPFTCYDCKNLTRRGHSNVYINAWKVRPLFLRVSVADPQSASIEDNHQFDLVQPSQKVPRIWELYAISSFAKGECLPISWIIFEESSPSHQTGKKWRPHPTKITLVETRQGAESGLCQMVDGSTIKFNLEPICL